MNELGTYFKLIRILNQIKIKDVLSELGFSRPYFAKIENTIEYISINNQTKKKLEDIYRVKVTNNMKVELEFHDYAKQFLRFVIYENHYEAKCFFLLIQQQRDEIQNMVCLPYFTLIEFVYGVTYRYESEIIDEYIHVLNSVKSQLDQTYVEFYELFHSFYCFQNEQYDSCAQIVERMRSMNHNDELVGIKALMSARLMFQSQQYCNALDEYQVAHQLLLYKYNFKQALKVQIYISQIYSFLNDYDKTITNCLINESYLSITQLSDTDGLRALNYEMLLYALYCDKQFDQLQQWLDKVVVFPYHTMQLCVLAITYMMINKNKSGVNLWSTKMSKALKVTKMDFELYKNFNSLFKSNRYDVAQLRQCLIKVPTLTKLIE